MKRKHLLNIASKIPFPIINTIFLTFPFLYKTNLIRYESGISKEHAQLLIDGINETKNLHGDIIECGSNRCGTAAILCLFLKSNQIKKIFYALDSFGGFIPDEIQKERKLGFTDFPENSYHYNTFDYVKKKIEKLKLSDYIELKKGFFQETLPSINSDFCMAFIDCDLGKSINYVAEKIWPHLIKNGLMFFHDYGWKGYQNVKPTVDAFVTKHQNEIKWHKLESTMYWIKKSD